MQDLIHKSGLLETVNFLKEQINKQQTETRSSAEGATPEERRDRSQVREGNKEKTGMLSGSEITIYKNALIDGTKGAKLDKKRISSSSEEAVDTSGENIDELNEENEDREVVTGTQNVHISDGLIDQFITDQRHK